MSVHEPIQEPLKETPIAQPSQDPNPLHQQGISPTESNREAGSVIMGGGMVAGAAGGAAVGTAIGGPVGTVVGATIGAVLGALGGYAAVEATDPEHTYWSDNYRNQPGYVADYTYDDYAPAYRLGYQGRQRYADRGWDDAQSELERDWQELKGNSRLTWEQARSAGRAAWHRVERALPGDADGDGR